MSFVSHCATKATGKRISAAIIERQRQDDADDDDRADSQQLADEPTAERGHAEAVFIIENREWLDWWLMQRFPGRTLEELDNVDWLRLQRAMEVERIVNVEQRHKLYLDDKLKADDLTPQEWRMIRKHNRLLGVDDGE